MPRHRVLVVDNLPELTESFATLLEVTGQQVFVAYNGPSAIESARVHRPNVAFLDIAMPGMNGYEVVCRLRALPELKGLTLVALTGFGQDEDRRKAAEAGFDHHLTKPSSQQALKNLLLSIPVRGEEESRQIEKPTAVAAPAVVSPLTGGYRRPTRPSSPNWRPGPSIGKLDSGRRRGSFWEPVVRDLREIAGAGFQKLDEILLSWSVRLSFLIFSLSVGFGCPPLAYQSTTSSSDFMLPSCMYGGLAATLRHRGSLEGAAVFRIFRDFLAADIRASDGPCPRQCCGIFRPSDCAADVAGRAIGLIGKVQFAAALGAVRDRMRL